MKVPIYHLAVIFAAAPAMAQLNETGTDDVDCARRETTLRDKHGPFTLRRKSLDVDCGCGVLGEVEIRALLGSADPRHISVQSERQGADERIMLESKVPDGVLIRSV